MCHSLDTSVAATLTPITTRERDEFEVLMFRPTGVLGASAALLVVAGCATRSDWAAAWPYHAGAVLALALSFVAAHFARPD